MVHRIKRHVLGGNSKNNILPDAGSDDSFEKFYEVEQILDSRTCSADGNVEYLVKWKDYPSDDNSWEPATGLYCPQALQAFKANQTNNKIKEKECVPSKSIEKECVKPKSAAVKKIIRKGKKGDDIVQPILKEKYFLEEDGVVPNVILGVDRLRVPGDGNEIMMALMSYSDGRMEFVPTKLLRENNEAASMLIDFYEQRVHLS